MDTWSSDWWVHQHQHLSGSVPDRYLSSFKNISCSVMTILIRLLLLLAQTKLGSECDLKKQLLLLLHVFKRSSLIIYTKMHNSLTYLLTTHKYNWLYIYYVVIHQHLFASCTCIFTHPTATRKSAIATGWDCPLVPVSWTGTPKVVPMARAFGTG